MEAPELEESRKIERPSTRDGHCAIAELNSFNARKGPDLRNQRPIDCREYPYRTPRIIDDIGICIRVVVVADSDDIPISTVAAIKRV